MPKICTVKDWGFGMDGTCSDVVNAKRYVEVALAWLVEKHDVDINDIPKSRNREVMKVRSLWHFIALEALSPWMGKKEISKFVRCSAHSTFYCSWKRQEKCHKEERLLFDGSQGS